MLYKKKGLPEVGDIVLCTVKKILYHSVFVSLDEYKNLEGMIHIAEIAPGRIRNLRDYVKENKTIVCKVLNMDQRKGNIDLSLRRVGKSQMISKLTEYKQEEKAEKLLEFIGNNLKKDLRSMYDFVGYKAIEIYGTLNSFFLEVVKEGEEVLNDFNLDKKTKDTIYEIISDKISIPEISVSGFLSLISHKSAGIFDIKKAIQTVKKKNIEITYLGAPKYKIEVNSHDYKVAEKEMQEASNKIINELKNLGGEGEFIKA